MAFAISVYGNGQHSQFSIPDTGLSLHKIDEPSQVLQPVAGIEKQDERTFLMLRVNENQLQIQSCQGPLLLPDGNPEPSGTWHTATPPLQFRIGKTYFSATQQDNYASLHPGLVSLGSKRQHCIDFEGRPPAGKTLSLWLEVLSQLNAKAVSSASFLEESARAVVEPGGMESGMIIIREKDDWRIAASHVSHAPVAISYNASIVKRVLNERKTFYHSGNQIKQHGLSTPDVSIVAAPIFGPENQIHGVVYGSREVYTGNQRTGIRKLEAQWIHLIAETVSSGIGRMHRETEAARSIVLLERAFSPQVASALIENHEILNAQSRELSILFGDLRGFSEISDQLGAKETFRLLSDVMNRLTACVLEENGVIIDYYGDGLAAMWNAPTGQPNHAERACRTARQMQNAIVDLNRDWQSVLGKPLRLGIGINSGDAQVGNAGSVKRLKYGPRGPNVNLAARIEAATKKLNASILISESTKDLLPDKSVAQKVGSVRLSGIAQPVNVYEWASFDDQDMQGELMQRFSDYERVLQLAEEGKVDELEVLVNQLGMNCCVDVDGDSSHPKIVLDLR